MTAAPLPPTASAERLRHARRYLGICGAMWVASVPAAFALHRLAPDVPYSGTIALVACALVAVVVLRLTVPGFSPADRSAGMGDVVPRSLVLGPLVVSVVVSHLSTDLGIRVPWLYVAGTLVLAVLWAWVATRPGRGAR